MNLMRFKIFLSFCVLGVGLVSCSKDSEVQYKDDTYNPDQMMMSRGDRSFTTIEDLRVLDFSKELIINTDSTPANDITTNLVLSTTCRAQSSQESHTKISTWPNPTRIPVVNLLHQKTLLHLAPEPIFCEISYTRTNSNNSTQTGLNASVRIDDLNSLANLPADHAFSLQTSFYWPDLENTALNPQNSTNSIFQCNDFSYTTDSLNNNTPFSQIMPLNSILESSPPSSIQLCRVLFFNREHVFLSPRFQLQIPVVPPTVTYRYSRRDRNSSLVDSSQKVIIEIHNSNTFPVQIRTQLRNARFNFRGFFYQMDGFYPTRVHELPMDWTWNEVPLNNEQFAADEGLIAPGNSTSYLVGSVRGTLISGARGSVDNSLARNYRGIALRNLPLFLGYNMGLHPLPRIAYLVHENSRAHLELEPQGLRRGTPNTSQQIYEHWDISFYTEGPVLPRIRDFNVFIQRIGWNAPTFINALTQD